MLMKKANLILTNASGSKQIRTGEPVNELLPELIGKKVTVWAGVSIRNSFKSQLSVTGTLEGFPEKGIYRILINIGTYTYFIPDDIRAVGLKDSFKDGSCAVIEIEVPKE